jgi:hypothetical protein
MKICRKSGRKRERREHGQPLMDWWKGRYYSVERELPCGDGFCRRRHHGCLAATWGEKSNLLHERFPKLMAILTVVFFVCFAQGLVHIYREKNSPTSTSISNMVLIDVAPSVFTNRPN